MYHKLSVVQKQKEAIRDYAREVLNPLDQFQTENYKFLVKKRDKEIHNLLEQEYDLYLEKLEIFYHIIECNITEKNQNTTHL